MARVKKEIADILRKFDMDPREALWDCHGTLVIYHKHCEIIAAKAGIRFDPPVALEANGPAKCVALCVTAHMDGRSEWATGEAAPQNNKNAYPYAMAEKRAKDRAVLKLVGLSGFVYSEDEADDFKDKPKGSIEVDEPAPKPEAVKTEPAKGFHYIFPDGKAHIFQRASAFLTALEEGMREGDPVQVWAINGSTAKMIAEKYPQAVKQVEELQRMATKVAA